MKDSTLYTGDQRIWINYDVAQRTINEMETQKSQLESLADRSNAIWIVEVILYIIGSLMVAFGKLIDYGLIKQVEDN